MKIVCATHSDRLFVEERASINAFERRFGGDRFKALPSLESFPPAGEAVPHKGKLSIWKLDERSKKLSFLRSYEADGKIQFAAFHRDSLLVLNSQSLEVLDLAFSRKKVITHPWMVGGHTVFVDDENSALVTSAPANCVLRVDLYSGRVIEKMKIPESYGKGYELPESFDLHDHFIPTDFQPTHVNCAFPSGGRVLVTLCIPGAIGYFEKTGTRSNGWNYRELTRGFRGCHGARINLLGEIFFTDSPAGTVMFLDKESGQILRRIKIQSNWLHDSDCVGDNLLVAGLSDKNTLGVYDQRNGECLDSVDCSEFGESVMFVNCCLPNEAWLSVLLTEEKREVESPRYCLRMRYGDEVVPDLFSKDWEAVGPKGVRYGILLNSARQLKFEYLLRSSPVELPQGHYRLESECGARKGKVSVGLLNLDSNAWVGNLIFDFRNGRKSFDFYLHSRANCVVVVSAANELNRREVIAEIVSCSLSVVSGRAEGDLPDALDGKFIEPAVGENLLPPVSDSSKWQLESSEHASLSYAIHSSQGLRFEYLLSSEGIQLPPGDYRLGGELIVRSGEVALGILDVTEERWIQQVMYNSNVNQRHIEFNLSESARVKVLVAAANSDRPLPIGFDIRKLTLKRIHKEWILDSDERSG